MSGNLVNALIVIVLILVIFLLLGHQLVIR